MHGRSNWVLESVERSLLRFATTLVGPEQARDVVQEETFVELCNFASVQQIAAGSAGGDPYRQELVELARVAQGLGQ